MANQLKFKIILAFIATLSIMLEAQSSSGPSYDPYWGIGIIGPVGNEVLNFPAAMIRLYDSPGGKRKYFLWKESEDKVVLGPEKGVIVGIVNSDDWIEVGYEALCLKYYQKRGSFILVLVHSRPGGFWISARELEKANSCIAEWKDFLLSERSGYYPNVKEGLVLRKKPSIKSESIVLLKQEDPSDYMITLTGKTQGLWAEVKVTTNGFYPCVEAKVKKRNYSGWIKILDNKGSPNIWFYTRGC
jgi:hypothetical protein